jgi:hypothetical protein
MVTVLKDLFNGCHQVSLRFLGGFSFNEDSASSKREHLIAANVLLRRHWLDWQRP